MTPHEGDDMAEEIRMYAPRARVAVFAAGSLLATIAGLWIAGPAGDGQPAYGAAGVVAGWLVVVVFALFTAYLLYRLVARRPSLVLGHEGIVDHATATSAGAIGWDEIAEVSLRSFGAQQMIVITVRDEGALLARQNPVKAALMRANRGLAGSLVNIPQSALDVSDEEALAQIERFRRSAST
jgi:hypothetical protein